MKHNHMNHANSAFRFTNNWLMSRFFLLSQKQSAVRFTNQFMSRWQNKWLFWGTYF